MKETGLAQGRIWITLALVGLAAGGAASQAADTATAGIDLSAVRTYRAARGVTVVDLFCRVPVTAVSALPGGRSAGAAFRFTYDVRDSSGLEVLQPQGWTEKVPAGLLGVHGASTGERLEFQVKPGRYTVEVAVTDSASGRVSHGAIAVEGYRAAPGASDVLLGTGIRGPKSAADTVPGPGELWNGAVFVQTSGPPALTPQHDTLGYYLELYSARPETVTVSARVLGEDGKPLVGTAPAPVAVGSGGAIAPGVMDLAGLPPGRYRLEVTARGPDSTLVRSAPFGMTGFETMASQAAVAAAAPSDRWSEMGEARLDSMYGPLIYLMTTDEQGVYSTLDLAGKREWMRQFWAKRDPGLFEQFYARVQDANREFREGGMSAIPGWRTDRGRILIKYGKPTETLERRSFETSSPYEVWKYTGQRALKYVFLDRTGFGNYVLIWTDDRHEASLPNWQELLGDKAVQDVEQF
jgi:GWxTD domain-containing protein